MLVAFPIAMAHHHHARTETPSTYTHRQEDDDQAKAGGQVEAVRSGRQREIIVGSSAMRDDNDGLLARHRGRAALVDF